MLYILRQDSTFRETGLLQDLRVSLPTVQLQSAVPFGFAPDHRLRRISFVVLVDSRYYQVA